MAEIKLKSYGKVNLSLDVTGKREDGYHDLETVMQKISLSDILTLRWTPEQGQEPAFQIAITCNRPYLPKDRRNLAYQAAEAMWAEYGQRVGGGRLEIDIRKHLPVSAGLAGGSSNAAAVLVGLSILWQLRLSSMDLCQIGEKLGADVPFCVLCHKTRYTVALCTGTGTELEPIEGHFKKGILLVKPPFGVSTKEVYKAIDDCQIEKRPDTQGLVKAIEQKDQAEIFANMINVLEEYTLHQYKDVKKIKDMMETQTNAQKVLMTGSGPTVFGVFDKVEDAKSACTKVRKMGYEAYWATSL